MKAFVDTSAWFAAANAKDRHHPRAIALLGAELDLVTSTFVIVETWLLLQSKISFEIAEEFTSNVRLGAAAIASVTMSDLDHAWHMPAAFSDQRFSLVDRTSFAIMQRLEISKAVTFDDDFVICRFGPDRRHAFEVLR